MEKHPECINYRDRTLIKGNRAMIEKEEDYCFYLATA